MKNKQPKINTNTNTPLSIDEVIKLNSTLLVENDLYYMNGRMNAIKPCGILYIPELDKPLINVVIEKLIIKMKIHENIFFKKRF